MTESQQILLAKWMDQTINSEELTELSGLVDLAYLQSLMEQSNSLEIETVPTDQMWESFNFPSKVSKAPKRNFLALLILGIMVLIAMLFMLLYNSDPTISTGKNEQKVYAFEDGSKAFLGPHSQISFDEDNYTIERTISMKGHVYFEVKNGSPFTVNLSDGTVHVIGTSFDIWNVDKGYFRVDCFEGRVKVISNRIQKEHIISAGQGVHFNNNQLSDVNTLSRKRPDWMDGQRSYDGIPVHLFLKDLSSYYDLTFSQEGINSKELISGSYRIDNLEKLIETIEVSNQWKHEKTGDNIVFKPSN